MKFKRRFAARHGPLISSQPLIWSRLRRNKDSRSKTTRHVGKDGGVDQDRVRQEYNPVEGQIILVGFRCDETRVDSSSIRARCHQPTTAWSFNTATRCPRDLSNSDGLPTFEHSVQTSSPASLSSAEKSDSNNNSCLENNGNVVDLTSDRVN